MKKLKDITDWYEKNERRISSASLVFGFAFDFLTLQRIDALRENLWIVANLLVAALTIVLLNKKQNPESHFWLLNILQFSFGATLGAFFIFYFRSATLEAAWPFLILLLAAMVTNELFQKRYVRLAFQVSFLYLAIFSFVIFLLPVLFRAIGPIVFLSSGALSIFILTLFLLALRKFISARFNESKTITLYSVTVIFITINVLYFSNLIPPIPLVLKDSGIYHSLERLPNGNYLAEGQGKKFLDYLSVSEDIDLVLGDPLFAYSAIFSPVNLDTRVFHEWQKREENSGDWLTITRIPLFLVGGRDEGFRTFSTKSNLSQGRWRVNVLTERGELIGRIRFKINTVSQNERLVDIVKD